MTIRILIADDDALLRAGLAVILRTAADLEVVAEAGDGIEAVRLGHQHTPDLVLMDVRMPGIDGIEATRRLVAAQPDTRILILTTFHDEDYVYGDTVQAGLGFAGIAIALLGRNNPVGIAFAALLWAYLDAQGNGLQINAGVSDRLVLVIQGVIVLSVVIAYEIVRRAGVRMEQRRVAAQLAAVPTPSPEKEGAAA